MEDHSFLAPPDLVLDWRRVVLTSAANRSGVLDRLPGTADEIADSTGLDDHSIRVLLDALTLWEVVDRKDGTYSRGRQHPDDDSMLVLDQHAQFMQRWWSELDDRLSDRILENPPRRPPGALESWLAALGANGRKQAPTIIDHCLRRFPEATSVLDVAGGHGAYGIEAARRGKHVTLLDLPEVIDVISGWESVSASGIDLFPGDVNTTRPEGTFDLVLCFGFSHTQPAACLGELFGHLASLTSPGGGIAVHTFLRDGGPVPTLFAVQMLLTGRGGDTHRLDDYTRWLTDAGFEPPHVEDLGDRSLLLARKT